MAVCRFISSNGTTAPRGGFACIPWPRYDGHVYQVTNGGNFKVPAYFYGLAETDGHSWRFLALPAKDNDLTSELVQLVAGRDDAGVVREVTDLPKALDALVDNRNAMILARRLTPEQAN